MFSKILLVAAMSIGAVACVGDVDGGTPGTENPENPNPNPNGNTEKAAAAKKEYEDNVYPIVEAKCGGCHKNTLPTFIGTTKDNSYAAVTGFTSVIGSWTPDSAGISNIPVRTAHNGITYDAAQRDTINGWLTLEAEARAGTGGNNPPPAGGETPGQASARLLKEFQKCMSLTAFNNLQVAQRMANTNSNGGQCGECHNAGTAGFIASVNSTTVFNALKNPTNDAAIGTFWLAQYYTPQVLTAPYQVIFNEAAFVRAGGGKYPFQNHPQFQLNGTGFTAVKNYLTEVKKGLDASGNCTTPPAT